MEGLSGGQPIGSPRWCIRNSPWLTRARQISTICGLWPNRTTCAPRGISSAAYRSGPHAASGPRLPPTSPGSARQAGRS